MSGERDEVLPNRSLPAMEQAVADTTRHLLRVPPELLKERKALEVEMARLSREGGRHTIRALQDGHRELTRVEVEVDRYASGEKSAEYRREADVYLRRMRSVRNDSAALGVVRDSILCHSNTQQHQRYRRRSDLQRVIRMARRVGIVAEEQRHSIIDEFLSDFHGQAPPVYLSQGDTCPTCDSVMVTRNSLLECTVCGTSSVVRDSTSSCVGFNDDVEYSTFAYKRDNHFQEWLSSTMAKQNLDVPSALYTKLMEMLYRDRVEPADITAKVVRAKLKELRERKYYEASMQIACKLTGKPPPKMSPAIENKLKMRFRQIQAPFEKFRDELLPDRKNFLSYSYVLYKLCELEGLTAFKECFSLLKGRDKLYRQDQIWRRISQELGWAFRPSI